MTHRFLCASIHRYLDPSGGAALATRELLERPASRVGAALSRGGEAEVFNLVLDGCTTFPLFVS